MFIVAVTRWGPGLDQQLPELAAQLGMFPYDLRARLAGPLPVIVARVHEREAASTLMNTLRGWGHGAVGCEDDKVVSSEAMLQVRDFRIEADRLEVEGVGQLRGEVEAAQVYMLIHAMAVSEQHHVKETSSKQFNAARALLSGGMVMSKTTTTTSHAHDSDSEERLYLFRRSFSEPLLFCQHQLRYTGLGPAMRRSSHDNFAALTLALRTFAPDAVYDDRLRTTRRKLGFEAATHEQAGKSKTSSVSHSNASGLDLAAHLLLVGLARGQL